MIMNKKVLIAIIVALVFIFGVGVYFVLQKVYIIERKSIPDKTISTGQDIEKPLVANKTAKGRCGDGVCNSVEENNPNLCPKDCAPENNQEVISDLKYSSVDSEAVKLDLYFPVKTCTGKYPLVIKIHGGAFKEGDKYPAITKFLTDACYAVASLNYRLSGEATFPAGNQDVKSAVRWLRANADKYNLDSENFGVMGGSAGGYYASFLGTTGDTKDFDIGDNLQYSSAVQAVVDEFGPVDVAALAKDRADAGLPSDSVNSVETKYIGCDIGSSNCKNAIESSPINYISKNDPPFLILHGAKDKTIPIKQSQDFYEKLKAMAVTVTFVELPNAGHGGEEFDAYKPQIVEFFDKYLK